MIRNVKRPELAEAFGRNKSSISHLLAPKKPIKMGRPELLSESHNGCLEKVVEEMVQKADANYEVTLPMVHRRSRLKQSTRTIRSVAWSWVPQFYEDVILTPVDTK